MKKILLLSFLTISPALFGGCIPSKAYRVAPEPENTAITAYNFLFYQTNNNDIRTIQHAAAAIARKHALAHENDLAEKGLVTGVTKHALKMLSKEGEIRKLIKVILWNNHLIAHNQFDATEQKKFQQFMTPYGNTILNSMPERTLKGELLKLIHQLNTYEADKKDTDEKKDNS